LTFRELSKPTLREVFTEWITRTFVNKAKEGGYVRIILLGSNIQFSRNTEKEQIKNNL
jgi:hypothetical protein